MNAQQLSRNRRFVKLCKEFGVEPTRRQASKFLNNKGELWEHCQPYMSTNNRCNGRYSATDSRCLSCTAAHSCFKQTYKELF